MDGPKAPLRTCRQTRPGTGRGTVRLTERKGWSGSAVVVSASLSATFATVRVLGLA